MTVIRMLYRLVKWLIFAYGAWQAFKRTRPLAIGLALWRILSKAPRRNSAMRAALEFVNSGEPAIYYRRGIRKLRVRNVR